MNGSMGQLLGDALLVVYTFFGVVPMLLNTVSQFGVLKRFSDEMVREGIIKEETVKTLLPKKQLAGVVISALMLFVLFSVCLKTAPYGWLCAGIPFLLGLFKYRNIIQFNSLTVQRFQNNFKGEYDVKKMKKYIDTHF